MIGRPTKTLRNEYAHIIYIRKAIKEAKHGDVLKVEFMSGAQFERTQEKLLAEFKYSLTLTIVDFTFNKQLWAYIGIERKAEAA